MRMNYYLFCFVMIPFLCFSQINELTFNYKTANFSAVPRTGLPSMSMRLLDNYNSGGPTNYGTVLELYGLGGHQTSQLYFGGWDNSKIRYRQAFYADTAWNEWITLLDSKNNIASEGNLQLTGSGNHYLSGGNFGIGTSTPSQRLDVNGNINLAGAAGRRIFMGGAGGSTFGLAYDSTFPNYGIFYTEGEPDFVSISPNGNATNGVMNIFGNGNVGIGTTSPAHKLDVIGTIRSREVKVDMNGADFVFEEKYPLMPLSELEAYIKKNKHLPEIAPAKEMQEQGSNLGDLNTKLLQKIEELTLYAIEQNKKIIGLEQKIEQLATQQKQH
nr:hypothetical protein [uncultured Flavobacterium sp.]